MKRFLLLVVFMFVLGAIEAQSKGVVSIQNGVIEARVNCLGAELTSLKKGNTVYEYIWQGNQEHWKGSSPILFPIVGSLKDGRYTYEGQHYKLPQHGFAKNMIFHVVDQSEEKVTFSLKSTEATKVNYPFDFELRVIYELQNDSILVTYEVRNKGQKSMYFSIGGHPGFTIPMNNETLDANPYLVFEDKENADIFVRSGKLLSGKSMAYLENQDSIDIVPELFQNGALIFSDLKSNTVELWYGNKRRISFGFEGFPYFALWSKPVNPGFICFEPWYGIPDLVTANGKLEDKKGVVKVGSQRDFSCSYQITILN
ncbi:aldose 1-epimerase family protein [Flagellimonas marinaquae]|nr:aldose 1-epimerase family protein [Allomuricauda aquimarina]